MTTSAQLYKAAEKFAYKGFREYAHLEDYQAEQIIFREVEMNFSSLSEAKVMKAVETARERMSIDLKKFG